MLRQINLKKYKKILHLKTKENLLRFQLYGSKHVSDIISIQASNSTTQSIVLQKNSFVKPQWLLPAGDINCDIDAKKYFEYAYRVWLITSSEANSGLSDPISCILLSIIGEHGRSILYRIPPLESNEISNDNIMCGNLVASSPHPFQRGSKNLVTFLGPYLGHLEAIWIAPEAGTWRLEEVTIVVSPFQKKTQIEKLDSKEDKVDEFKIMKYVFKCEDILLGDGSFSSALEIKPSIVDELADINSTCSLDAQNASNIKAVKRKEALKQYEILKTSLLVYSAMFVTIGIFITTSMGITDVVNCFTLGGMGGFVYLFLLQQAVDMLPGPAESSTYTSSSAVEFNKEPPTPLNRDGWRMDGRKYMSVSPLIKVEEESGVKCEGAGGAYTGFRAPIVRFSLVAVIMLLVSRLPLDKELNPLPAQQLLAAVLGFLTHKLALLLAVYKPLPITNRKDS